MDGEKISLQFLSNESEEDEGLGHAGIETYRAKPYAGAAREVGQNSRDAAVAKPVRLTFDLLEVPQSELPGVDKLSATVACCFKEAIRENREKEKAFFSHAKGLLSRESIKVLRIADSNTTGARGPADKKGTPFYSLTRANGVSAKDREDSGGSYGIGKNAAFAISDLRTVFYTTVYRDVASKKDRFLALGKSVLVSHHDESEKPFRQIGYWGLPDFKAVESQGVLPEWLRRKQAGTSVFVVGFREEPNWQDRFASALIANFFPAIHIGDMEFVVNQGSIVINKETLAPLFASENILRAAEENGHKAEFEIAREHYRCIISPDAKDHIVTIPLLGRVLIRVLVAEGLSKKICITRNGLVITDNLKNFGQPFLKFPMYQDFAALIAPLDPEGSAYIKKLEDPKHEELSPEGLPDEATRDTAKRVIKRLGNEIREAIKADSFVQYANEVAADELREYFATDSETNKQNRISENDDPDTIKYRIEPAHPKQPPHIKTKGDEHAGTEDVPGIDTGGPGPHPGPGPRPGPGPGPGPGPQPKPRPGPKPNDPRAQQLGKFLTLFDVRNCFTSAELREKRTIFFTPNVDGTIVVNLEAVGVNDNEGLNIVSAENATAGNGSITVEVRSGQRRRIDVVLSEPYDGPIEIKARLTFAKESASENQ